MGRGHVHVVLLLRGSRARVREVLPSHIAELRDLVPEQAPSGQEGWVRVRMHVEHLDRVVDAIATLDLPFVVGRPEDLRAEILRRAQRLLAGLPGAARPAPASPGR